MSKMSDWHGEQQRDYTPEEINHLNNEKMQEEKNDSFELSTDRLINLNKEYIGEIVDKMTSRVLDGYVDELETLIMAKKGVELFSQLEKQIRPIAEDKVKIGKGEIYTKFGVEVQQAETGVSYDFSYCNDPQWERLNQAFEKAKQAKADREKTLKTFTKPVDVLDPETGEVSEVRPPLRGGKLGLKLSIK